MTYSARSSEIDRHLSKPVTPEGCYPAMVPALWATVTVYPVTCARGLEGRCRSQGHADPVPGRAID